MATDRLGSVTRSHRLIAVLLTISPLVVHPAMATDAALSRALTEAGCSPANVRTSLQERGITAYNVTCVGAPVRKLVVICAGERCSVSTGRTGDEPVPGGENPR